MSDMTFEGMKDMAGQELGVSDWIVVDQDRIDQFAACTEDNQWIHIDPERAKRESPFRTTIAHGYLTLSLIAGLALQAIRMPSNLQAAFNYGLDKVRFVTAVKVGARVRLRVTLISLEEKGPGQHLMKTSNTIEIEGEEKPALIAETLAMLFERREKRGA
ncbi:MAG TPA: MaoC family dehydratase [Mesorhizobium sp.]|jgi:acyl dehydratase